MAPSIQAPRHAGFDVVGMHLQQRLREANAHTEHQALPLLRRLDDAWGELVDIGEKRDFRQGLSAATSFASCAWTESAGHGRSSRNLPATNVI
jgi:hypothetical protein